MVLKGHLILSLSTESLTKTSDASAVVFFELFRAVVFNY